MKTREREPKKAFPPLATSLAERLNDQKVFLAELARGNHLSVMPVFLPVSTGPKAVVKEPVMLFDLFAVATHEKKLSQIERRRDG